MIKIEFLDDKKPFEIEADSVKEAMEKATFANANLSCAVLRDADLRSVDLRGANLSCADLRDADLRDACLRGTDLRYADLRGANLSRTDLRDACLRGTDLRRVDLRGANLSCADLCGANIDFSCWPLWCGSIGVTIDKRILCQLLYHTLNAGQSIDDPEVKRLFQIPEVVNLANQCLRADACGKIELKGETMGIVEVSILS